MCVQFLKINIPYIIRTLSYVFFSSFFISSSYAVLPNLPENRADRIIFVSEDFSKGNINNWSNIVPMGADQSGAASISITATNSDGIWLPSSMSDGNNVSSMMQFPVEHPIDITHGDISVYFRAKASTSSATGGRFYVQLNQINGYARTTIRPGGSSQIFRRNNSGTLLGHTPGGIPSQFNDEDEFYNFKMVLSYDNEVNYGITLFQYTLLEGAGTTDPIDDIYGYLELYSVSDARLDSGIFTGLSIFSANAPSASIDSLVVAQRFSNVKLAERFTVDGGSWITTNGGSTISSIDITADDQLNARGVWKPSSGTFVTSTKAINPALDISKGDAIIDFRAYAQSNSSNNGKFYVNLDVQNSNRFVRAQIRPDDNSQILGLDTNGTLVGQQAIYLASSLPVPNDYVNYRFRIELNPDGTMKASLYQDDISTQVIDYKLLGTRDGLDAQTGVFDSLTLYGLTEMPVYVDSISISQAPEYLIMYNKNLSTDQKELFHNHNVFNNAINVIQSHIINVHRVTDYASFANQNIQDIQNHIDTFTDYGDEFDGILVLDIEIISQALRLHPREWADRSSAELDLIYEGLKRHITAVRNLYPKAKLSLYGVPTLNANPVDPEYLQARISVYAQAAAQGVFDQLDFLSPILYLRQGPNDLNFSSNMDNYIRESIDIGSMYTTTGGSQLPALPLLNFLVENGNSNDNGRAVNDLEMYNLMNDFISKIKEKKNQVHALIWWSGFLEKDPYSNFDGYYLDSISGGVDGNAYFEAIIPGD